LRLPATPAVLSTAVLLTVSLAGSAAAAGPAGAHRPGAAPAAPAAPGTPGGEGVPVPASGVYTGATVNGSADETWQEAFSSFERTSGRGLALHRTYQTWEADPVSGLTRWDVANGHIPAVSLSSPSWASIASGARDAEIVRQADAFKAFGAPLLLSLNHEPERDAPGLGTPEEYRAAWRHWVGIYRARGVTNVSFTWILMAASFSRFKYVADDYFPGDDVVDWLGADGYNWFDVCKDDPWRPFDNVFADFRTWAARHPQPVLIAEVGSAEDRADPARKARWIADIPAALQAWPQVKGISWFNVTPRETSDCQMRVETSPAAAGAWTRAANDAYMTRTLSDARPAAAAPEVGAARVVVDDARSAEVTADVTTYGASATMRVEYGTTDAYGSSSPPTRVLSSSTPTAATARLRGLAPSSTYHYRVVVTNEAGSASSPAGVFQTPGGPAVTTQPPQQVEGFGATLTGVVDPGGLVTEVTFAYGTAPAYGTTTAPVTVAGDGFATAVTVPVTGLRPGTTYHVRMTARNAGGTASGDDVAFTTAPVPTTTTRWNGGKTATAMTLHGAVDANGLPTVYTFEYGRTASYGSTSATATTGGAAPVEVQARITDLSTGTYHYRIVAENAAGRSVGDDATAIFP